MWKTSLLAPTLILGLTLAIPVSAQAPDGSAPVAAIPVPVLLAGEALALADMEGGIHTYGEAQKESPMGSLAKLVWLRLEGDDWGARDVIFKCKGEMGPYHCWLRKGHGKVDLAKATQESCNLAFLAWAIQSAERWKKDLGEGAGRARLEDVFQPFLGDRLPPGDKLPELTPAWIGDGDLLRTSPEALIRWLVDPAQDELLSRCRRLLLSFVDETFKTDVWWMKTGTGPVLSDPSLTSAWVVGSNGLVVAVLHLPAGRGKVEGIARFKAVMGIHGKK